MLYALYLLMYLSVLVRMVLRSPSEGLPTTEAYILMAGFLALGIVQVPLSRLFPPWTHVHLALQCGIIMALFLTKPSIDYYGVLAILLSVVAGRELPDRWDVAWLAILCAVAIAGIFLDFGVSAGAGYVPVYIAGCLVLGLYGRASRKTEAARARSDELRAELEAANRRLRRFAEQAEEAAAAQERARLSRELHDAATQTVFSINLTAEAARMARKEDPDRVPALLDRLQELARDALAELRSLVHELRPATGVEEGLVPALERHASLRERRDGLKVSIRADGGEQGSIAVKEVLYRAAVEALNNVVKHAEVSEARVELSFSPTEAVMRVSDAGKGFDTSKVGAAESFGLISMRERVEALNGVMSVRSAPNAGTDVEVRLPLSAEAAETGGTAVEDS
jgi:signal transduction histidine kinase